MAKRDRFHALSVRDLLDAREAYHVHLTHKANVFATAIGLYLIRDGDPDSENPEARRERTYSEPRTLRNSSPRNWSWPCILVFVRKWLDREEFAREPEQIVPRAVYLPDGRVVPICVVEASPGPMDHGNANPPIFPSDLIGGGYPCVSRVQGMDRIGSLGCLVTDGDGIYALTNRHVAGPAGREIKTVVAGVEQRIGLSAGRDMGKRPLELVYPGWSGSRVMVNLDAGLVRVDDVKRWTAQVYGIGEIGSMYDLDTTNFDLDLIGLPLKAYGAASGIITGQIGALFFRYKSVAGTDYVSDFLIAPRKGDQSVGTKSGDSGTIWFHEPPQPEQGEIAPKLCPIAMQWGGQALVSGGGGEGDGYALASCLSTICRELEVDVIADWNSGLPETWGLVGHVKVGALACELIADKWLRDVFMLNQANIGVPDSTLGPSGAPHDKGFSPLSDVADLVWRNTRQIDSSNHFADMDEVRPSDGKTLLELTANGGNITPDFWNKFYADINAKKRGALPFRVWSMVDEMVDYARAGDLMKFLCAAGLMAHYTGDACQPLHVSRLHHGEEGASEAEKDVHSDYETAMLDRFRVELIAKVAALKASAPTPPVYVGGGRKAAKQMVALMQRTVKALPPKEVVDLFNSLPGKGRIQALWDKLGDRTAGRILDGSYTLARIWEAAWKEGRSGQPHQVAKPTTPYTHAKLAALYNDRNFTPSYKLEKLKLVGDRLVPVP